MNATKNKILEVSLDLFSRRGYSAVSIRDICKEVGIKESSVYYHFKNKQAIFDELLSHFQDISTKMMEQLDQEVAKGFSISNDNFYDNVCCYFFEKYFLDDYCNKVMRLLLIEQLCNEEVQAIYDTWMFKEPLAFQSKVFSLLMKLEYIKNCDSHYLAVRYYAPIFFFAQRWLFSGNLSEVRKNDFLINAYKHTQMFFAELEKK